MFTVKKVEHSGLEFILPAVDVRFEPRGLCTSAGGVSAVTTASPAKVIITQADGSDYPLEGYSGSLNEGLATVYVMNDHGKTVATYQL